MRLMEIYSDHIFTFKKSCVRSYCVLLLVKFEELQTEVYTVPDASIAAVLL